MKTRILFISCIAFLTAFALHAEQSLSAGYGGYPVGYEYRASQFIEYSSRGSAPFGYSLRLDDRFSLPSLHDCQNGRNG